MPTNSLAVCLESHDCLDRNPNTVAIVDGIIRAASDQIGLETAPPFGFGFDCSSYEIKVVIISTSVVSDIVSGQMIDKFNKFIP